MKKEDRRVSGEAGGSGKGPDPAKVKRYADAMRSAYEKGGDIDSEARPKLLVLGLASLINGGEIDAAAYLVPRLFEKFPFVDYFSTLAPVFEKLPPRVEDETFAGFVDDPEASLQTVRREGAKTLLLGFCGVSGKMTIPLTLMHRIFGPANVHVAYIRMEAWAPINGGPMLGKSVDAVMGGIGKIIEEFAPTRVVCQAHSAGGTGALMTSLKHDVDSVLCFGSPISAGRSKGVLRVTSKMGLPMTWSFRDDYESAKRQPSIRLVYGDNFEVDRQEAELMQGLPKVALEGVTELSEHDCFTPLLISGRYDALLRELVTGEAAGPAGAAQ